MERQLKKWIKKTQNKSDKDAANELISYYYREIYAYVYKQTMKKELSLDITQEIFINMLQSINLYDEKKSSFRTWLYKIATCRIVDYYRSKSYCYDQFSKLPDDDWQDKNDFTISIENKIELENVNKYVSQMGANRQQIFRLKIFGGYAFADIAILMNIPESTVKTNYYTVLKLIRENLKEGSDNG